MRQFVLVVDDEAAMRKYVSANLKVRGYEVLTASDGSEALKVLDERHVDLVILDIMMPGPDGLEVLQALRRDKAAAVIVLSARGREGDKVKALDLGADDYMTKPFGVEELMARVRAALRRTGSTGNGGDTHYRHGDLEVDFQAHDVRVRGDRVSLTPREYEVLAHLSHNAGRVLTHRQILQAVWGGEYGDEADYIWTYVRRIRRKIESDPESPAHLLTEPGVGYRAASPD